MNFFEAMAAINDGKTLVRKSWDREGNGKYFQYLKKMEKTRKVANKTVSSVWIGVFNDADSNVPISDHSYMAFCYEATNSDDWMSV